MKRPVRFFNTTGPCNPDDHYMLPPKDRLRGAKLHRYVRDKLYWMLHAPRQTGKTTFLFSWMRELNAADEAVACYVSIEDCQGMADVSEAMRVMDFNIRTAFKEIRHLPQGRSLPLIMRHCRLSAFLLPR